MRFPLISLFAAAVLAAPFVSAQTVQPAGAIPLDTLRRGGKMVIVNAQSTPLDGSAALLMPDLKEFAEAILDRG